MKYKFLVGMALLSGCSFRLNGKEMKVAGGNDMASAPGGDADMASSSGSTDMAGASTDMATLPGADLMKPLDLGPVCIAASKRCSLSGALETCRGDATGFDSTPCAYGCGESGGAHCKVLTPSPPIVTGDFNYAGLAPPNFSPVAVSIFVFDTKDGTISLAGSGTPVRAGNQDPAVGEVVSGIGFHRGANKFAVWTFASLTIGSNATITFADSADNVNSATANQYGVAFASVGAVNVAGTIDLRGYPDATMSGMDCAGSSIPGPGGGVGGFGFSGGGGWVASGNGHGAMGGSAKVGGQGASFGGAGSLGGGEASTDSFPAPYGTSSLNPLAGGSGGGAGGFGIAGGGGGGAFELVALTSVSISGTINAGGCGGGGTTRGGGGGGSGGGILIEAGTVTLGGSANVDANGGGGGGGGQTGPGGGGGADGTSGPTGMSGGAGGTAAGSGAAGGNGGGGATVAGTKGNASTNDGSGGGGGGVGRIRINTTNGTASGSGTRLSPTVGSGASSVGMLNLN